MADRAFKLTRGRRVSRSGIGGGRPAPGLTLATALAAFLVLALGLGTVLAVALRAEGSGALVPSDWAAVRFTLTQALLSALISTGLAIPVARALARRRFAGRGVLILLFGAPFLLPVIVAILGLLAVFGQAGVLNNALAALGLPSLRIYGLHGVVLAHVFFNLPLAVRLILQAWLAIPTERFRAAAALGFGPRAMFTHIEVPMLRATLPGAFLVILLICLSSFAVALTLGGGPRATTVELAIYQAFTFEFDLGRAARLASVQFALAGLAGLLAFRAMMPAAFGAGLDRPAQRWDGRSAGARALDAAVIALAAAFLLLPLAMVVAAGLPRLASLPGPVWLAALRSVLVALGSVAVMLALALPLALTAARSHRPWAEGVGLLMIAASPLVMGTGLFLMLFPLADPTALALPVTALVNAAASLPFALRALVPALREAETQYSPLAASLGMTARDRLRLVILPRARRPLGFAMGLTAALSMGDLGVIALFSRADAPTLPLALYRLMGAYRMADAAGAALLLLTLSLALFWVFDRGGRADA